MADRKIKDFKLDKTKSIIPPNGEINGSNFVLTPVYEHTPLTPDTDVSPYSTTRQGKPIHGILAASTAHGEITKDEIAHVSTIKSEGVDIIIEEEAIGDLTPQTFKVLIRLLEDATKQLPQGKTATADAIKKGRIVRLSLNSYMAGCNLRDIKEARSQLNNSIKALYAVSLEWNEDSYEKPEGKSRKVKVTKHHRMRITDHTITEEEGNPVKGGVAEFRFSFDMAEYLSNAYLMPFNPAIYTINTHKNPYSLSFAWKLFTLQNVNITNHHLDRLNETTVKTLLSSAKGIPQYSTLAKRGNIYDRLIKPFDRDLAALKTTYGILSDYWYYTDKGERVYSSQLGLLSYTEFSALHIHYELKDYPDQTPRLEAKSRRIRAAISRRKSAAKKKKTDENGTGDGAQ